MQVISSERIEDSDLYNVTVNMVLKKGGSKAESKPPTKSLELLTVVEPEEAVAVKAVEEKPVAPIKLAKKPIVIKPKKQVEPVVAPAKPIEEKPVAQVKLAKKPIVIKQKKQVKKEKSPDSNSNFLAAATLFGTEQ
jgi:hypothetical protein